jgi:Ca2+-binding EF-hand superfamily protein
VIVLLSVGNATYGDETRPNSSGATLLQKYDADRNGMLSRREVAAAADFRAIIDSADSDGNGELSALELKNMRTTGKDFFAMNDANRDGALTPNELANPSLRQGFFKYFDKNRDGRVTPEEMGRKSGESATTTPTGPMPLGPRDLNMDGVLTVDEFDDSHTGKIRHRLLDVDKDGRVTREELKAAKTAVQTRGKRSTTDATAALDPKKVVLFVVGLCDFEDGNHFAQDDRMDGDLVRWFRGRGTSPNRIVHLRDAQATAANIKSRFDRLLSRSRSGDQLVVLISTHGGRADGSHYFCAYDGYGNRANTWKFEALFDAISTKFRGESAFIFGDCCHAGQLIEEARLRSTGEISYFVMGASMASHLAPGAYTFFQAINVGLRGSPYLDMDGDGFIRLGELMYFTNAEMAFTDYALPVAMATGGFTMETVLSKRVGALYDGKIGRRAEVLDQGRPYPRVHVVHDAGEHVLIQDVGIGKGRDFGVPTRRWVPLGTTRPWKPRQELKKGEKAVVKVWNRTREKYEALPAIVRNFRLGVYEVSVLAKIGDNGRLQRLSTPELDLIRSDRIRRVKR